MPKTRRRRRLKPKFSKKIFDSVHGYIDITEKEREIIDTAIFQRLRRIAHLGLADFVYPGATHSRFSHAIGSLHVMHELTSNLLEQGAIDKSDMPFLRLAALLHDVGHYPLSHVYDNSMKAEYGERARHENVSKQIIQHTSLRKPIRKVCDPEQLAALFGKQPLSRQPSLFQYIVSSSLDVDKLDYLQRDSLHTGVAYGSFDVGRLLRSITVDDFSKPEHLVVEERGLQAIENFLVGRFHMFQSVYFHKAVVSFELMMSTICRKLMASGRLPSYAQLLSKIQNNEKSFSAFDDSFLWNVLKNESRSTSKISELIQMIFRRQDLKMADESLTLSPGRLPPVIASLGEEIASGIARRAEVDENSVFFVPYPRVTFLDEDEPKTVYIESKRLGKPIPIANEDRSIISQLARERLEGVRIYALNDSLRKKVEKALASKA